MKRASSKSGAKSHSKRGSTARAGAKSKTAGKSGSSASRTASTGTARAASKMTTDHEEIRRWVEERGGHPACVKGTGSTGDIGLLRIDFPAYSGEESLQHISWDQFFEKFDERELALLHQEQTAGGAKSNFNKLVSREMAEQAKKPKIRKAGGA
jgi:hypothetical protein